MHVSNFQAFWCCALVRFCTIGIKSHWSHNYYSKNRIINENIAQNSKKHFCIFICNRVSVTFKHFFFVICTFQYDLTKQMDSEMSNRSRITTKTTKWLHELRLKSLGPYFHGLLPIFWPITRMVYKPHRHKIVNFSKEIVVLPAPTDNPHHHRTNLVPRVLSPLTATPPHHRTETVVAAILYASVLRTSHLLVRDHAIFTRKMAAELILIAHFTNVIFVYSTIMLQSFETMHGPRPPGHSGEFDISQVLKNINFSASGKVVC